MRTREDQIKPWGYISPFAKEGLQDRARCDLTITRKPTVRATMPLYTEDHILEAERRAEERVRAEIARDSSKNYPVHYAPTKGRTFPEMQEYIRSHPLYLMGDARLVWVSEGDLYMPGAAVLVEKDKPSTDAAREVR